MAKRTQKPPSVKGVSAVERALAVLTAFRRGDGALSLADLARRTGLVKSTIMRLAVSLEQYRLLARLPDGSYRLDAETLRLGTAYQQAFNLSDHAVAHVRHRQTRETFDYVGVDFSLSFQDPEPCGHRPIPQFSIFLIIEHRFILGKTAPALRRNETAIAYG